MQVGAQGRPLGAIRQRSAQPERHGEDHGGAHADLQEEEGEDARATAQGVDAGQVSDRRVVLGSEEMRLEDPHEEGGVLGGEGRLPYGHRLHVGGDGAGGEGGARVHDVGGDARVWQNHGENGAYEV